MEADFVIVGSGLTGATIARTLADEGCDVLVLERRSHLGGNVHDWTHESGIRVHTYGPHYFRTSSEPLWRFVTRFAAFHRYEPSIASLVDGRIESWPVTEKYLERTIGRDWRPDYDGPIENFEDACLSMMPRLVYDRFVRDYSEKQWGVPARALRKDLAGRFDVRKDGETRLSRHRYQGIPLRGYAAFMRSLLAGIPVELGFDYTAHRQAVRARRLLVFTGPIDEFFDFDLGRLAYRGQRRVHEFLPGVGKAQPCGQVNNPSPQNGAHIRTLEWKHMMPEAEAASIEGTLLTRESPYSPSDPNGYEYPFPDDANRDLYDRYRRRADALAGVLICGRLGEYKYYDMDQAIARARILAARIVATHTANYVRAGRDPSGRTISDSPASLSA
jgi:UDP-galactopyranose mutase